MTEAGPPHSPSIVARDIVQALGNGGTYRVVGTAGDLDGKVIATIEYIDGNGEAMSYDVLISQTVI